MSKLLLGTVLIVGLSPIGAGCIITTDDDDDTSGDGSFPDECGVSFEGILYAPTWLCPPDADAVTFTIFPAGGAVSLEPDTFDCVDEGAFICLDPGGWDIEILPEGSIGDFAAQLDSIEGGDGDNIELDYVFAQDGGFFAVDWTIDGGDPFDSCADIGADRLAIDATLVENGSLRTQEFPCEDAIGIAPEDLDGWPLGEYVLDISLVDADGAAISDPAPITDIFLDFADQLSSEIGTIDFTTL